MPPEGAQKAAGAWHGGICGICGQGQVYKLDFNAAYSLLSCRFTPGMMKLTGHIRLMHT